MKIFLNENQYKILLGESEEKQQISKEEAKIIGNQLKINWSKVDLNQFHKGLNVEMEHGKVNPKTDVTNDSKIKTAKIALAHLNELPDYYTKLAKIEH